MKFSDIKSAVKHLLKETKCLQCEKKYGIEEVSIIATTQNEGMFEMTCEKCKTSTIITMSKFNKLERTHKSISKNDVLDIRNFLNRFDGNFKKLFIDKK